jgi:hypothetical protein
LRQAQILILEILNVFLWLKFSPFLNLNKNEHFSKVSPDILYFYREAMTPFFLCGACPVECIAYSSGVANYFSSVFSVRSVRDTIFRAAVVQKQGRQKTWPE